MACQIFIIDMLYLGNSLLGLIQLVKESPQAFIKGGNIFHDSAGKLLFTVRMGERIPKINCTVTPKKYLPIFFVTFPRSR